MKLFSLSHSSVGVCLPHAHPFTNHLDRLPGIDPLGIRTIDSPAQLIFCRRFDEREEEHTRVDNERRSL